MNIYTKEYFLNRCDGFKSFRSSGGVHLSKRQKRVFEKINELKPSRVLEIGCGRGELALNLSIRGMEVWAVDSSAEAFEIASDIKNRWEKKNGKIKLNLILSDALNISFPDSFFDCVVMMDFIEHVEYFKSCDILKQSYRFLKNNGRIFIHTSPGKIFKNYGLEVYRIAGFFMGYKFKKKLKELLPPDLNPPYHVNEWSSFMFKKVLKECEFKNLEIEFWKNPHYAYYFFSDDRFLRVIRKISLIVPWKELFYADIFVSAVK